MKRNTDTLRELVIDSFAGGGGASHGIKSALGRGPDVAINHDASAILMHKTNHPETVHLTESIWKTAPARVTKGRPVGLLWSSPDCCHFSRAKGAKPVKQEIRSLAWVVIKWAMDVRPRVIILENVREFESWGPLIQKVVDGVPQVLDDGSPVLVPDPTRQGHSFKRWVGRLRGLGYDVQWRVMNAADYGAPTHRRRLFLIARCDGEPIVWPKPTHGDPKKLTGRMKPWRTAAECIDWSIPCPSIFERKKPLAENTLRRIAMGIKRYVLENPKPFIVQVNHGGPEFRGQGVDEPLPTVTGKHGYGAVVPHVTKFRGNSVGSNIEDPLPTITSGAGSKRPAGAAHALGVVAPVITRLGQTGGNGKYTQDVKEPLGTITSKAEHLVVAPVISKYHGQKTDEHHCTPAGEPLRTIDTENRHSVVAAFLAKHYGGVVGHDVERPIGTVTAWDHHSLVGATLVQTGYGERPAEYVHRCGKVNVVSKSERKCRKCGKKPSLRQEQKPRCIDIEKPLGTVVNGQKHAVAAAFLARHFGKSVGQSVEAPAPTAMPIPHEGLVAANLVHLNNNTKPTSPDDPLHAVTSGGNHAGLVAANIIRMNYGEKQWNGADEPLPTVTSGNHAALVYSFLVKYFGTAIGANVIEPMPTATGKDRFGLVTVTIDGQLYVIVDIGMRMLWPRELARANGFPDSYILTGSKSSQVAKIGNSVPPVMAKVLVKANYKPASVQRKAKVS